MVRTSAVALGNVHPPRGVMPDIDVCLDGVYSGCVYTMSGMKGRHILCYHQ
jgi:hypothetical protein